MQTGNKMKTAKPAEEKKNYKDEAMYSLLNHRWPEHL